MGSFGIRDDEDSFDEDSFDTPPPAEPQNKKRTYPVAFEEPANPYSYNHAVPVAIEDNEEWSLPLGLTAGAVMECLTTALGWIQIALTEYGGRFFAAVGSWMEKDRASRGDGEPPSSKRQRVAPRHQDSEDESERSPLLSSRPSQPGRRSPPRPLHRTPFKSKVNTAEDIQESFFSAAPYVTTGRPSLPSFSRSRRHPRPSLAQRYRQVTSRLGNSQSTSEPSAPGGELRKSPTNRPGPYDRIATQKAKEDAESRLERLQKLAKESNPHQPLPQDSLPRYEWLDEEAYAEFSRYAKRPSKKLSTSSIPTRYDVPAQKEEKVLPKFELKFGTPIPTSFRFGGHFTSPPRSGGPEYLRTQKVSEAEKARFPFVLPPPAEKERYTPGTTQVSNAAGSKHVPTFGDRVQEGKREDASRDKADGMQFAFTLPQKTDRVALPLRVTQLREIPKPQQPVRREENHHLKSTSDNKNSFTILTNQEPKDKVLMRKTLPKSQKSAHPLDTQPTPQSPAEETQISQSFPPSNIPAANEYTPRPPSATPGGLRRTKSVVTPRRSSRRARFTHPYAEDSHREFIRDLRQILGQKKAKRDQEEKEIEEQIRKLREEGQAAEESLTGEIPRLPELLARKVHEALFDTPDNAVVVENAFGKLSGRDIHRLQKGEWLNDEVINYYLNMLKERSFHPETFHTKPHSKTPSKTIPKTFAFSTFFYELLATRGYSAVRRWTKRAKINLFDVDRFLVPVNKGGFHWVLGVVNIREKRIEYYDSMGREGVSIENRSVLETIRAFMVEEAKAQNRDPEEVSKWSFYVPKTPKQKNGWDCGVFTCITAERLTGDVGRMNYGQDHMDRLREYMAAEIIDGVFYH